MKLLIILSLTLGICFGQKNKAEITYKPVNKYSKAIKITNVLPKQILGMVDGKVYVLVDRSGPKLILEVAVFDASTLEFVQQFPLDLADGSLVVSNKVNAFILRGKIHLIYLTHKTETKTAHIICSSFDLAGKRLGPVKDLITLPTTNQFNTSYRRGCFIQAFSEDSSYYMIGMSDFDTEQKKVKGKYAVYKSDISSLVVDGALDIPASADKSTYNNLIGVDAFMPENGLQSMAINNKGQAAIIMHIEGSIGNRPYLAYFNIREDKPVFRPIAKKKEASSAMYKVHTKINGDFTIFAIVNEFHSEKRNIYRPYLESYVVSGSGELEPKSRISLIDSYTFFYNQADTTEKYVNLQNFNERSWDQLYMNFIAVHEDARSLVLILQKRTLFIPVSSTIRSIYMGDICMVKYDASLQPIDPTSIRYVSMPNYYNGIYPLNSFVRNGEGVVLVPELLTNMNKLKITDTHKQALSKLYLTEVTITNGVRKKTPIGIAGATPPYISPDLTYHVPGVGTYGCQIDGPYVSYKLCFIAD